MKIVVGVIIGGLIGAGVTHVERQIGPVGHTIIGSIAGGIIGGLLVALFKGR